jgi:hypothetical protein
MPVSTWTVCCSGLLPVWDWFLSVADLTILGLVWLLFRIDSFLDPTPECARQLLGLAWLLLSPLLAPASTLFRTGHGSCFCIVAL